MASISNKSGQGPLRQASQSVSDIEGNSNDLATPRASGDEDTGNLAPHSESHDAADGTSTPPQVAYVPMLIPQWQRELAASRVSHRSRASSVMSTRTRLTHQSDDAQSVEIEAGGQSYRISRVSGITNITAPPPYPGPPLAEVAEESDDENIPQPCIRNSSDSVRTRHVDHGRQSEASSYSLPLRTHQPPGAIQDLKATAAMGLQAGFELPAKLRSMLPLRWYMPASQTTDAPSEAGPSNLRRTQSDSSSVRPSQQQMLEGDPVDRLSTNADEFDEQIADVSRYYNRIMREVDREHRRRLHERDVELAKMRQLLNDQDRVMRQQIYERDHANDAQRAIIRNKDIEINELKTQKYELEEGVDQQMEKARNQVENMWERRWKEYEAVLKEKMAKSWETSLNYWQTRYHEEAQGSIEERSAAKTLAGEMADVVDSQQSFPQPKHPSLVDRSIRTSSDGIGRNNTL